ncbi:hypothetical protein AB4Y32_09790 [Paraburkholderia phymatum]|uniref:Uncharacterized protein n=1 Tax=Paraburkholderia phymatum TaxID=148447 RepID=A0ACC6TXH8_9BURK
MSIDSQIAAARAAIAGHDGVIRGRRKPRMGKPGGRGSLFFSVKNRGFIPVRSRLQRLYCFLLEEDPEIVLYRTDAIEIRTGNQIQIPTFLVWKTNGVVSIREIVSTRSLASPNVARKFKALSVAASSLDIPFEGISEKEIRSRVDLDLMISTYNRGGKRYGREVVGEYVLEFSKLIPQTEFTVGRFRSLLTENSLPCGYLEAAIFHRLISLRGSAGLDADTMLEVRRA